MHPGFKCCSVSRKEGARVEAAGDEHLMPIVFGAKDRFCALVASFIFSMLLVHPHVLTFDFWHGIVLWHMPFWQLAGT